MEINDTNALQSYTADTERYQKMQYKRCGNSGILLPKLSLGLWHNFGDTDDLCKARTILRTAFDHGITHFDLANNYGPPYGAAETNFGRIYQQDFKNYRDELLISSKAGYDMWPGPYGNFGSKKYLVASIDQSLKRMGLDYVDIFYHHRPDPNTPLEETMAALHQLVTQGKALYVGISNYPAAQTAKAYTILKEMGTPLVIHQPKYSLFERWVEDGLLQVLDEKQIGSIVFSPLAQGLLTDKYLDGFPEDSRAVRDARYLKTNQITDEVLTKIRDLNSLAKERGQSLAQMAIAWLLHKPQVTSVLVGVSKPEQLKDNVKALEKQDFTNEELERIETIIDANN
ncbi:L-glyceraldehyde 3-phosphate reductase [Croceivirga sp. JEA036]|uniref:L-glyceraldehyde 3-phosphate reductase n=1 Tax=Croceivirga sp. JEA036 TaxID=2721162 RepID=UPI00143BB183|nr:L-glyceraldehyde 3-phosphate reductase [Croceivirga sp. JEA036]NJB37824.1 L-glyceraldehyde 3-phosphate reductase [Croceivirga sp. JEA036]